VRQGAAEGIGLNGRRQLLSALPLALGAGTGLGLLPAPACAAAAVRTFGAGEPGDLRFDFPLALLRLLLQAGGLPNSLDLAPRVPDGQVAAQLLDGRVDVAILPSISEPADALQVLRVPIRRGLLGVRVLMVRRERLAEFSRLRDLEQLKRRYVMGYGAHWLDNALLRQLGFRLRDYSNYSDLFRALAQGEVDYLNRGVNEVWAELDHPLLVPHGLGVVPGLALSYPLDDYFHLSPLQRAWLPRLQAGMQTLWRDGRYRRLYFETFGRAIERAQFGRRRVLQVVGYGVKQGTPLQLFDALRLRSTSVKIDAGAR
jgi:ABC-type amino acid transport substrate-binding protein